MTKSKIEKGLSSASKKAVKGAVRASKKSIKKNVTKAKKAVKKAVKAIKKNVKKKTTKKPVRTSVSGRKYKGLSKATKERILSKRKETNITNLNVERAIKLANDRIRRIERIDEKTKQNLTEDSNEYRLAKKYAVEQPNAKGKIYNSEMLFDDNKLRFISYSEYLKLDKEDRKYYRQVLRGFLGASTTTKRGIEEKYKKAHATFMSNYGSSVGSDFSVDDYKRFFKTFRDIVNPDRDNQEGYNKLTRTLEFLDIESLLTNNELEEVLQYIDNDEWGNIPRKYFIKNYW